MSDPSSRLSEYYRSRRKQDLREEESASQMYARRLREIDTALRDLKKKLDQHKKEQAKEPLNWGYAGDLGHVQELLAEINTFLQG